MVQRAAGRPAAYFVFVVLIMAEFFMDAQGQGGAAVFDVMAAFTEVADVVLECRQVERAQVQTLQSAML